MSVHLYRIPQAIHLTLSNGGSLMNYPVNRTDFQLYRHVDNEVDFFLKDFDRKAVSMANATVTINVVDPRNDTVVLSQDLLVVDPTKGLARFSVNATVTAALAPGSMRYTMMLTRGGTQTLLYTDRERKAVGVIYVAEGPLPDAVEATEVDMSALVHRNSKRYTPALPGAASVLNYTGEHSTAILLDDFSGIVTVQGTLDSSPSTLDVGWFDVKEITYNHTTGLQHINFEGNLMWTRFVIQTVEGDVTSIQYRN